VEVIGRDLDVAVGALAFLAAVGGVVAILLVGEAEGMAEFMHGDGLDVVLQALAGTRTPVLEGEVEHHAVGLAVELVAQALGVRAGFGNADVNARSAVLALAPAAEAQGRMPFPGVGPTAIKLTQVATYQ